MFKTVSVSLSFRIFYMDAGRDIDWPLTFVAREKGREERKTNNMIKNN